MPDAVPVRARTLSSGDFGDSVVLDHEQPKIRSWKSRETALTVESLESTIDEEAPPISASLLKLYPVGLANDRKARPPASVLRSMLDQLTPDEIEQAARTSYQYCRATREHTVVTDLAALRNRAAIEMLCRFWHAHKHNVDQSLKHLRATLRFRRDFHMEELRDCFHIESPRAKMFREKIRSYVGRKGKLVVRGYDKDGRACFHFLAQNSPESNKQSHDGVVESHLYVIEKALACTERKSGGKQSISLCSVEVEGFAAWHAPPYGDCRRMLDILSSHYPERLFRVFLINPPKLVRFLWSLLRPFIDVETKEKFQFVSGDRERIKTIGTIMDTHNTMPYQLPGGELSQPIDVDKFFELPFDVAYDEVE